MLECLNVLAGTKWINAGLIRLSNWAESLINSRKTRALT